MIKLKLTQNKYSLIDDEDFEYLNQWKWSYDSNGYARRNDKGKKVYLHRLINNTPSKFVTDHKNKNKLDNRKSNLRTVTKSENALNAKKWKHNKSGYTGISWSKSAKKWLARIQLHGKVIHLGLFSNLNDAVKARQIYA